MLRGDKRQNMAGGKCERSGLAWAPACCHACHVRGRVSADVVFGMEAAVHRLCHASPPALPSLREWSFLAAAVGEVFFHAAVAAAAAGASAPRAVEEAPAVREWQHMGASRFPAVLRHAFAPESAARYSEATRYRQMEVCFSNATSRSYDNPKMQEVPASAGTAPRLPLDRVYVLPPIPVCPARLPVRLSRLRHRQRPKMTPRRRN